MNGHPPNTATRTTTAFAIPPAPGGTTNTAPTPAQQTLSLLGKIAVELENLNGRMDHLFQLFALAAEANQNDARVLTDYVSAIAAALGEFLHALPAALAANTNAPAAQPAEQAADAAESTLFQTIDCTYIVKTNDENNRTRIAVKGGQYQQFGIPIYEEYWPRFGIDPARIPPGTSRWDHRVRVEMKLNSKGKLVPARAVGFAANDQTL